MTYIPRRSVVNRLSWLVNCGCVFVFADCFCFNFSGVLVVNVTWRGKTYVGTLLDATKHDWAPPRYV